MPQSLTATVRRGTGSMNRGACSTEETLELIEREKLQDLGVWTFAARQTGVSGCPGKS
jgi:hypothetical protein